METALTANDSAELLALEAKIKAVLPAQYHECYADVKSESMGSAALKFGSDGLVAWDDIWTTFCDLALAGGPPHRGTLLEPATAEEVAADPEPYQRVVAEIGRGIWLTANLPVLLNVAPGWVGVRCRSEAMASWLLRAIVAENVAVRQKYDLLYLPAGPRYRVEKEVKNVVTAVAKTCHYWGGHMSASQQTAAAALYFTEFFSEPRAWSQAFQEQLANLLRGLCTLTGLQPASVTYQGWLGLQCRDKGMAVWLMRAVLVDNVLARREGDALYLATDSAPAAGNPVAKVADTFARAWRLWNLHTATAERCAARVGQ